MARNSGSSIASRLSAIQMADCLAETDWIRIHRSRHTPLGQRPDLDQVDGVLRGVAAIPRSVARRLCQQAALVVVPDGLDRHARVARELTDGDHAFRSPFDQVARMFMSVELRPNGFRNAGHTAGQPACSRRVMRPPAHR